MNTNPINISTQMPDKGHENGGIRLQVRAMLEQQRRAKSKTNVLAADTSASTTTVTTSGGNNKGAAAGGESKYATLMKKLVKIDKLIKKESKKKKDNKNSDEIQKLKRKRREYHDALKETEEYKIEMIKQRKKEEWEQKLLKEEELVRLESGGSSGSGEEDNDGGGGGGADWKVKRQEELERLRQRANDYAAVLERHRQRRQQMGGVDEGNDQVVPVEHEEERAVVDDGNASDEEPEEEQHVEEEDRLPQEYDDDDHNDDDQEDDDEVSLTANTEGMEDSFTSLWASVNELRPEGSSFSNLGATVSPVNRKSYVVKKEFVQPQLEVVDDGEEEAETEAVAVPSEEVVEAPEAEEEVVDKAQVEDEEKSSDERFEELWNPEDEVDVLEDNNEMEVQEEEQEDEYMEQEEKPKQEEEVFEENEGFEEANEEEPASPVKESRLGVSFESTDDQYADAVENLDDGDEGSLQDEDEAPCTTEESSDFDAKSKMWMSMPELRTEGYYAAFSENTRRLLREIELVKNRQAKLELQLLQNGLPVSDEIPYDVAKAKIAEISEEMTTLKEQMEEDEEGTSNRSFDEQAETSYRYYELEEEMEKYTAALALTDEYAEEQIQQELQWEEDVHDDNMFALQRIRRHMPVNIRYMSEEELATKIPHDLARKFKRTNVLQLLRVDPDVIETMHPSLLEALRTTGLTLTERRALYEHLKDLGNRWQTARMDKATDRKWTWHESLKTKFRESLEEYEAHMEEYGEPGCHEGCPLPGTQCPYVADEAFDYYGDYGFTGEAVFEESESPARCPIVEGAPDTKFMMSSTMGMPSPSPSYNMRSGKGPTLSENEIRVIVSQRAGTRDPISKAEKKLLDDLVHSERRALNLEKQLVQAGITVIAKEDIPYAIAKAKAEQLTDDIKGIASAMASSSDKKAVSVLEKEYLRLSRELEKYTNALMLTKEWAEEQKEKEQMWEENMRDENIKALKQLRRHMPVNIREMGEVRLTTEPTPNGKLLPKAIARKFKRTSILTLIRMDPIRDIEPMHPSSLEALGTIGLTLTERRALHEHLRKLGPKWKSGSPDKATERKRVWYDSLQSKFKEQLAEYQQHVDTYHSPACGAKCPLKGSQCPVTADSMTDYSGDYGFTEEAEYGQYEVQKSNLLTVEDFIARNLARSNSATQLDGLLAQISARN